MKMTDVKMESQEGIEALDSRLRENKMHRGTTGRRPEDETDWFGCSGPETLGA